MAEVCVARTLSAAFFLLSRRFARYATRKPPVAAMTAETTVVQSIRRLVSMRQVLAFMLCCSWLPGAVGLGGSPRRGALGHYVARPFVGVIGPLPPHVVVVLPSPHGMMKTP